MKTRVNATREARTEEMIVAKRSMLNSNCPGTNPKLQIEDAQHSRAPTSFGAAKNRLGEPGM